MERPRIWVSKTEDNRFKLELSRDGYKLCDLDRLAAADLACLCISYAIAPDEHSKVTHDLIFRGITLAGLTQMDMLQIAMQTASSLTYELVK